MDFRCISADSHIVEPPNCYVDFIEPKYRDVAPRVVRHTNGYFKVKDLLNVDHLLWANDCPYSGSTWPWQQDILARHTVDLTPRERRKILRDNVRAVFNLPLQ